MRFPCFISRDDLQQVKALMLVMILGLLELGQGFSSPIAAENRLAASALSRPHGGSITTTTTTRTKTRRRDRVGSSRPTLTELNCVESTILEYNNRGGRIRWRKDGFLTSNHQDKHRIRCGKSLTSSMNSSFHKNTVAPKTLASLLFVSLLWSLIQKWSPMLGWLPTSTSAHFFSILQGSRDFFSKSLSLYTIALEENPMVTKSISAGLLGFLGDFMAQRLELRKNKRGERTHQGGQTPGIFRAIKQWFTLDGQYDTRRGMSFWIDGLVISGPLMHLGYDLFEKVVPMNGMWSALLHVVADSVILDSIFVATTIWVTGLLEGYSIRRELIPQFRKDYIPALKMGFATSLLVLPFELVCFRLFPLHFRVLAVNMIDIIWDSVISHMAHRSRPRQSNGDNVINDSPIGVAAPSTC